MTTAPTTPCPPPNSPNTPSPPCEPTTNLPADAALLLVGAEPLAGTMTVVTPLSLVVRLV
jgi:hypothetical protein